MPIAIKKILKLIEWSLFLLVLLVLFVVASPLLPTERFVSTYVVATGSMEPEIMTGSLVLVLPSKSYGEKDVVVFKAPDDASKTIVHRIDSEVKTASGNQFLTKGDNNDSADPWTITKIDIKGEVKYVVPYVGSTIEWVKTPLGFGLFMLLPALIFGILQFLKINEGINDEVEKRVEEKLRNNSVGVGTVKSFVSIIILATAIITITATPKVYALFSSTVTINELKIEIADFAEPDPEPEPEFDFEGGLSVFDKTTNTNLNIDEFNAQSRNNVNIVFRPVQLPPNSHHYTIIMQDMNTHHMVHYRTMLSRWTMENYTRDGHLGYTVWYEGLYWLQVNSYDMMGNPVGEFYAILRVGNIGTDQLLIDEPIELEIEKDQEESIEESLPLLTEEPVVEEELLDEEETVTEDENILDDPTVESGSTDNSEDENDSGKDVFETDDAVETVIP